MSYHRYQNMFCCRLKDFPARTNQSFYVVGVSGARAWSSLSRAIFMTYGRIYTAFNWFLIVRLRE